MLLLVAHTSQVILCKTLYMELCVNLVWPHKIMFTKVFDAKYG